MTTSDPISIDTLARLHPLRGLSSDLLREVAPLCHRERVTRSLDPSTLRDWRRQIVYLARGELKLDFADGGMQLLVGGSGDSLMPLGRGTTKLVATKAITDVELFRFDEDELEIVMTWDQLAGTSDTADAGDGTDWRTKTGMFSAQNLVLGVFAALPTANIDTLLKRFVPIKVKRDEVIVRQGDQGDYYYVIDRGRCLVTREVGGATMELAELKNGEAFGEEALLADTTRNATVTMKTDGKLLRLDKADFSALLKEPLLHRLSLAEARHLVAAGATWLDVRFPAEYQYDGLPGAINIPLNEIRSGMPMLDRGRKYVVYCQTGRRSAAAAFLLSQKGINAELLDNGLRSIVDGNERFSA